MRADYAAQIAAATVLKPATAPKPARKAKTPAARDRPVGATSGPPMGRDTPVEQPDPKPGRLVGSFYGQPQRKYTLRTEQEADLLDEAFYAIIHPLINPSA